jgi:hypothetical protein
MIEPTSADPFSRSSQATLCASDRAIHFPVIVGVTGHRDIDMNPQSTVFQVVQAKVRETFGILKNHFPTGGLYLLSGAAAGADQLAAAVAAELQIPLIIVAPMPLADYEDAILKDTATNGENALKTFKRFWNETDTDKTALTLELPWLNDATGKRSSELQYEQFAVFLSRYSHVLLALWDGEERRDGSKRGGTAQVIQLRQTGESDAEAFALSPLFPKDTSRLDLTLSGPIVHIVTPRGAARAEPTTPSGAAPKVRLWEEKHTRPKSPAEKDGIYGWSPDGLAADWEIPFWRSIEELNKSIAGAIRQNAAGVEKHVGYLRPTKNDVGLENIAPHLAYLRRLQATADMAAQGMQQKLMGEGDLAMRSYTGFLARFWLMLRRRAGAHFFFAFTVPLSVLLLGLFAHMKGACDLAAPPWSLRCRDAWPIFAVWYAGLICWAGLFYIYWVRAEKWQEKFLDYRAIAEAMRVQVFWCLAAVPSSVSDHYLRKHFDELGWIQQALRGPALWAAAVALKLETPQRDNIRECWLENQHDWFVGSDDKSGKYLLNEQALKFHANNARGFFWVGVGLSICLAAYAVAEAFRSVAPCELLEGGLILFSTLCFGAAGFNGLYMEKMSYEAHAHAYLRMGRLFGKALVEVDNTNDVDKYCEIILELGREALAENADWLIDHRGRPISNPQNVAG